MSSMTFRELRIGEVGKAAVALLALHCGEDSYLLNASHTMCPAEWFKFNVFSWFGKS